MTQNAKWKNVCKRECEKERFQILDRSNFKGKVDRNGVCSVIQESLIGWEVNGWKNKFYHVPQQHLNPKDDASLCFLSLLQGHRQNNAAYRCVPKRRLFKERPLLCNARKIHARNNRTTWSWNPFLSKGLVKHVPAKTNTRANNIRAIYSMLSTPRPLLCNGAMDTLP
jgi:hypothetical protein